MIDKFLVFYSLKTSVKPNLKQDLSHHAKLFDFTEHIHTRKHPLFWANGDLGKDPIKNYDYVSDIAASVITKFITTEDAKKDTLNNGLACCKDILNHVGFRALKSNNFISAINPKENPENVILTLGCQTPHIIKNRGIAAARLYKQLLDTTQNASRITVYFSGSSPNRKKKQITQREYDALHEHFFTEIANIIDGPEKIQNYIDIKIDHQSHNTLTNISECLHKHIIPNFPNKKINLFVVSSTFHLIRISQAIIAELNTHETKEKLIKNQITLNGTFLVGSEIYPFHKNVIEHSNYVKNMFYDIFHYFLKNKIFKKRNF
jgi:hypothetical protein